MIDNIRIYSIILAFCLLSSISFADTTFILDDSVAVLADGLADGDTISVDGIDMVFSSVITSNGSPVGDVEDNGILISASTNPMYTDVIGFSFAFNQDVQIQSYTIGAREDVPLNSAFTLAGAMGVSDPNVIPDGTSVIAETLNFQPGGIATFEAGQTYTFTHNLTSIEDSLFNLKSITVAAIVPEPAVGTVLLCMGIISLIRRR